MNRLHRWYCGLVLALATLATPPLTGGDIYGVWPVSELRGNEVERLEGRKPPPDASNALLLGHATNTNDLTAMAKLIQLQPELLHTRYRVHYFDVPHDGTFLDNATPLHIAAMEGHFTAVQWLLANGADVHAVDARGSEPFAYAVLGHSRESVLELLLASGADIEHVNNFGHTALSQSVYVAWQDDKTSTVEWLVMHGADPNLRNRYGETVFTILRQRGLNEEFLDWDWSDQPQWRIVEPLYRYTFHIPGLMQFLVLILAVGAVVLWIRRRCYRLLAARDRQRMARWAGLETGPKVLPTLDRLYRRRLRLQRWTWMAAVAGCVAVIGVIADSLLMQFSYIDALLGFALGYCLLYALLWLPWSLSKLGLSVALLALSVLAIPALVYQGLLMYLHLKEVFVCAVFELTAVLFAVQVGLFGRLIWINARLLKSEWSLNRKFNKNLRAQENTGIESPSGKWDEGKP